MKKLLLWQLFIPLLSLSIISFLIASMLNKKTDYASIFLNLSTDLIMVIVTVWYVDKVIKRHEDENWKDISYFLKIKLYQLSTNAIKTICIPIGLLDNSRPEYKEFLKRFGFGETGTFEDYYGDFAKKFCDGTFISDTKEYYDASEFSMELRKNIKLTYDDAKEIHEDLKKYREEAVQLIDMYGAKLNPKQLMSLMNFQNILEGDISNYKNYIEENKWKEWYTTLFFSLQQCLQVLEASELHWQIEGRG